MRAEREAHEATAAQAAERLAHVQRAADDAAASAADGTPSGACPQRSNNDAAKNPLSQARCSRLKGAVSGTMFMEAIGRARSEIHLSLNVNVVGILRAYLGERILDVVPAQEAAVGRLEH